MRNITITLLFIATVLITNAQTKVTPSRPLTIGTIEQIYSTVLGENRTLNVYLPDGYNENDTIKYPVIYVLDGSIDEDFLHIVGIVQYNNFSWINRVPKSIVVGIANVDRRRDFTSPSNFKIDKEHAPSGGGSAKFINFIENELQPFINKKFKTTIHKTIIGQSLAGLLATEILYSKPTLFDKYIIVSPSLWWNDGSLLKLSPEILLEKFTKPISIYIGVGKEGLTPGLDSHVMEVDANLLFDKIKQGKSKTVKVTFDYLPNEDHATVTHPAVFNAFRALYPDKNDK